VLGDNPLLWCWPLSSPGDGLNYLIKSNTDPLLPYSWPPRDPKDMGPSIIERVEQEHKWDGPKLVRRDSEGYLVKEITMEDRMRMLNADNIEYEREELEKEEYDQLLEQQQEINPDEYYYDSNSVTSDVTDYELSEDEDNRLITDNSVVREDDITHVADGVQDDEWVNEE
jgi:hypothetical protein